MKMLGEMYKIRYAEVVISKDISKLDPIVKARVKKSIEIKLLTRPEIFGKPLQHSLQGYRSLRVGEYRVVFLLEHVSKYVSIFLIAHRSVVYAEVLKRLGK